MHKAHTLRVACFSQPPSGAFPSLRDGEGGIDRCLALCCEGNPTLYYFISFQIKQSWVG